MPAGLQPKRVMPVSSIVDGSLPEDSKSREQLADAWSVLLQWRTCGMVLTWSSLLSTVSKESVMISDAIAGISATSRVAIRLVDAHKSYEPSKPRMSMHPVLSPSPSQGDASPSIAGASPVPIASDPVFPNCSSSPTG